MDENVIGPTPFIDWCGIWPGHGGVGEDGLSWIQDPPLGDLQLKVQPGRWSEPFLHQREHPWEAENLTPLMVLREGDRLRVWYHCTGEDGNDYDAYAERPRSLWQIVLRHTPPPPRAAAPTAAPRL